MTAAAVERAGDDAELVDRPCWCAEKSLQPGDKDAIDKGACDLVVRLKVVVPDLPGLGVWVLTTGSVYAAMELPGQVLLLDRLREQGALVPAQLVLQQRTEKKAWEKYERRYPVPTLRIRQTFQQLAALNAGAAGSAALPETPRQLESSRPSTIAGRFPPHVEQLIYACGEHGVDRDASTVLVRHFTGGRTDTRKDLTLDEATAMRAALDDGTWRELISPPSVEVGEGRTAAQEPPASAPPSPAGVRPDSELAAALATIANLPDDLRAEAHGDERVVTFPSDPAALDGEQRQYLIDLAAALAAEAQARRDLAAGGGDGGEVDLVGEARKAGVRAASLLKAAREFAADLGVDPPKTVEEVSGITDDSLVSRLRGWLNEKGAA